ncbi:hypothetical protein GCM10028857_24240 [Salinarchaeum chitinilyticum]
MPAESTGEQPAITLYRLQACPFCERVVRRLHELDLDFQSRFIEPMHGDRDVVKRVAGVRTVPVIVDENTGVTMAESANVVEYLDGTYDEGGDRVATDGGHTATDGDHHAGGDV